LGIFATEIDLVASAFEQDDLALAKKAVIRTVRQEFSIMDTSSAPVLTLDSPVHDIPEHIATLTIVLHG
jgi:hypothetical protein